MKPCIHALHNNQQRREKGCYQYSDSIKFNNNGQLQFNNVASFEEGAYTIEAMVNLSSHANQVLFSKLSEEVFGDSLAFYRYRGLMGVVDGGKLHINLYGRDSTEQKLAAATSKSNIWKLLPLGRWTHIAIQRTGSLTNPLRVFINGTAIALQYGSNTGTAITDFSSPAPLTVGNHSAIELITPERLQGSIKNMRIYNRLLLGGELRQNAFGNCQLPASSNGLVFWAPMNTAVNNLAPDVITRQNGLLTGFTWQPFIGVVPDHKLPTTYQYNSLNQVVQQYSPDGDTSLFWYDRLGRLTASQNKEQKENASYSGTADRFSYTGYDPLGRIKEVGEKSGVTDIRTVDMLDTTAVKTWLATGTDKQVTKTIYDDPVSFIQKTGASRKRVTASVYLENKNDTEGDSTVYAYDISGNVKTLLQHNKALVAIDAANGKKRMDYAFDLVSGKVNSVSYQRSKGDQFFYKYLYDAENRVVSSLTSRDEIVWTEDARYQYYLHGPLARTELGQHKVQGTDYAYTLQGWLKGINGDVLDSSKEMGGDAFAGSLYSRVSKDVYGFKLGYFNGDYSPIGGSTAPAFGQYNYTAPTTLEATGDSLFNGNISFTTLALSKINNGSTTGYSYGYDQLNRLVQMRQHSISSNWTNSNIISAYSESIAYDANGNILKYLRKGAASTLDMDSLNYKYNRDAAGALVNNKLNHVRDAIGNANYTIDIDNQAENNYAYDSIGNLKKDVAEGINNINWTVYGKIKSIDKATGADLMYGYDPSGNRILKEVTFSGETTKTFYVRDASGNVMGIYSKKGNDPIHWNEQHLYGSSRLGIWNWDTIVPVSAPVVGTNSSLTDSMLYGSRTYELSNHLGNVLATISDKKVGHDAGNGTIDYYLADVITATDYYPFGSQMPNRTYRANSSYRYGFNGKENDNEIKGEGNQQDYGMRIYDPRLGKFLSVDPLTQEFPFYTPYQFAGNKPIYALDLDGAEELPYMDQYQYNGSWGVLDRLKAIPNAAGKIYNHALAGTWNSGVANVRSVAGGTWTQDMSNELKQIGSGIKKEAVAAYSYHTTTSAGQQGKDFGKFLADPQRGEDILEFGFSAYTGSKIGSGKGNLLKPTAAKEVAQVRQWVDDAGNIIWPKNNGFAGTPKTATLQKGAQFDRYGAETGSFASPVGTPYTQRSLAPGSKTKPLNTYEVLKPFDASSGKAAAWFGEQGGGTQYKFNMSIEELKKGGYIKKIE